VADAQSSLSACPICGDPGFVNENDGYRRYCGNAGCDFMDELDTERTRERRAREDFEQLVTDILVAVSDWTVRMDGPDVDDAREAVMRELLAHERLRHG
jgi:hypothetical protein